MEACCNPLRMRPFGVQREKDQLNTWNGSMIMPVERMREREREVGERERGERGREGGKKSD